MAKKTRRARRRDKAKRSPRTSVSQPAVSAKRPVEQKELISTGVDLTQEYEYVFADLRKIAIIAAIMFVLLFVLAFALR